MILPLFVLLLFGMMEAGWAFAQSNDVRHGAREGARLAAVNFGDVATIGDEVCARMDLAPNASTVVTLFAVGGVDDDGNSVSAAAAVGRRNDEGRIRVVTTSPGLTGVISGFVNLQLVSDIDFRLEQPADATADWWAAAVAGTAVHPCAP